MLELLSRRYDVEILLSSQDLSPDLRTRLSEQLDRLDEEADKIVNQCFRIEDNRSDSRLP